MGENSIFGYGSLILPTSIVSRFVDLEEDVGSIYEQGLQYGDEGLVRDEADKAWEMIQDDIDIVPVKIRGFKRTYGYESPRGGSMLSAEHTGNEDDFINGVVVTGLEDEHVEDIDESEDGYDKHEIHRDSIETYVGDDILDEMGIELPENIEFYIGSEDEKFADVNSPRNETYHGRILTGIDMLGDLYGDDVADQFLEDFLETTYEESPLGKMKTEEATNARNVYQKWLEDELYKEED